MPDLNSVPASPHALSGSRRPSAAANDMPPPSPSLNILPSNQLAVENARRASNASLHSPQLASTAPAIPTSQVPPQAPHQPISTDPNSAVTGPGPIRHPRPLTAAELHAQLEKEQEAVVNRLTRELQLLRTAHNASVVSNASSTSAGNASHEQTPADPTLLSGSGFSIPSSANRRHNRTSSNTSTRSLIANLGSGAASTASGPVRPVPVPLSRQNSSASHRSVTGTSPATDAIYGGGYFPGSLRHPGHHSSTYSTVSNVGSHSTLHSQVHSQGQGQGQDVPLTPGLLPGTSRYEETVLHREQLDAALKENEDLKKRIRELERQVRDRRRSESVSTTTSTGTGGAALHPVPGSGPGATTRFERTHNPRQHSISEHSVAGSVGVGVPDDELRVGESASNAGLTRQNSVA